jgi:hypothetical protein
MPSLLFSFFPLLSSPYSLSPTWQLPQFFQVTQILVFAFFMCFLLDDITIFKYRWRRNWPITLLIKHIDASITVYSHSQLIGMIHQDCRVGKVNVFFFSNAFLWIWMPEFYGFGELWTDILWLRLQNYYALDSCFMFGQDDQYSVYNRGL